MHRSYSFWSIFSWSQFILLLVAYLWLGTINVAAKTDVEFNDLLLHGVGYVVAVFSASLPAYRQHSFWRWPLFLFCFSVAIEIIQSVLPWRSFSLADIAANSAGIFAGLLLLKVTLKVLGWEGCKLLR